MLEISYTGSTCLSQLISAQFALENVLQPEITKKSIKTLILTFKGIQGH